MFEKGGNPATIVEEHGWLQVSDEDAIEILVEHAMAENPDSVADYRKGKKPAAKFLVGQVMRLSKGKANPQLAGKILEEKLAST